MKMVIAACDAATRKVSDAIHDTKEVVELKYGKCKVVRENNVFYFYVQESLRGRLTVANWNEFGDKNDRSA